MYYAGFSTFLTTFFFSDSESDSDSEDEDDEDSSEESEESDLTSLLISDVSSDEDESFDGFLLRFWPATATAFWFFVFD